MSTLEDRMTECADFLDTIWGTEDRGLYTIVVAQQHPHLSDSGSDVWHTYAFRWPKGRQKAVERVDVGGEADALSVAFALVAIALAIDHRAGLGDARDGDLAIVRVDFFQDRDAEQLSGHCLFYAACISPA